MFEEDTRSTEWKIQKDEKLKKIIVPKKQTTTQREGGVEVAQNTHKSEYTQ